MIREFKQDFFLSAGETNAEQELSLPLLTSKIIDIATAHANSLGIGNPSMQSLGCGWVLSRIAIEMFRYPSVNQFYSLTTWVESWNRHFSVRNFMISDQNGEPIGYASSVWMVLNMNTRENYGLSHLSIPADIISDHPCPIAKFGRHPNILVDSEVDVLPRGVVKATIPPVEYTFNYCDIDFYRHVNTVRYVSLLLNTFTLEEMDQTQIERLEMAFMHESHYGERVTLLRADQEIRTEDGKVGTQSHFTLTPGTPAAPTSLSAKITRRPRPNPTQPY